MREVEPWWFQVEGTAAEPYTVDVRPNAPFCKCTCTAWAIRRNRDKSEGILSYPKGRDPQLGICKHVKAVLAHLEKEGRDGVGPSEDVLSKAIASLRKTAKEMSN